MKKFTVFLLSLILVLGICPSAFAEESNTETVNKKVVYLDAGGLGSSENKWYVKTWDSGEESVIEGEDAGKVLKFSGVESSLIFVCVLNGSDLTGVSDTDCIESIELTAEENKCFVISQTSLEDGEKLTGCWVFYGGNYEKEADSGEDVSDAGSDSSEEQTADITEISEPSEPQTTLCDTSQPTSNTDGDITNSDPDTTQCTVTEPQAVFPIENDKASAPPPSLNLKTATVKCGKVIALKVSGKGSSKVSFYSSDSKTAKVTSDGKVYALKRGFAKITAKVGKKKLSFTIKVTSSPKLSKTSVTIKKGRAVTIEITGKSSAVKNGYSGTKYAKIVVSSGKSSFKIKGKKRGSSTVRVRVNGVLLKIKVKVK